MWTSVFFGEKNMGFFEIYGVSALTRGGVMPVRKRGGGESIFRDFVRMSFMGDP